MINYIILLLALLVLLLAQKNKRLLKQVIAISKNVDDNNINIFEKRENYRVKRGLASNVLILDKDIIVYDDWDKELKLIIFTKGADNFPFMVTIKKNVSLEEATTLFGKMKEHYDKGGRLYVIPNGNNKEKSE